MFKWQTRIIAVIPGTNQLAEWEGEPVDAISIGHAEAILNATGRGYMQLTGNYIDGEVDFKTGERISLRQTMFN